MTPLEQQLAEALQTVEKKNKRLLNSLQQLESEYTSSIHSIANSYERTIQEQRELIEKQTQRLQEQSKTHQQQLKHISQQLNQRLQTLQEQLEVLQTNL